MIVARSRRHGTPVLLGACVLAFALLMAWTTGAGAAKASSGRPVDSRPNIVFILTDDLSWNLVTPEIAPHIYQLEQHGETFDHYFVTDSLCCPSRASIFTGLYPHDTHVMTNLAPNGGFAKFQSEHLDRRTFAVALHKVGYRTSMLGKYLNGYGNKGGDQYKSDVMNAADAPVPPGWTDWHVSNSTGYAEYNFRMNDNGAFNRYTGGDNYGVDVLNRDAQKFITANAHRPFFVEAATFAPHRPFTPAIRNKDDFPGLIEPRDTAYDAQNINPPAWLGQRPALTPAQVAADDAIYRKRAQSLEAVDKLLADTEATLAKEHLTKRTYIVFSSDNGYHLGQHRLLEGKQTAFDTDIRVPLIVTGPGVPAGRIVHQVVQNTDLCPTFEQLGGAAHARPIDGTSFMPLLDPSVIAPVWPTVALIEHHGGTKPSDPDSDGGSSNPPSYEAIRISAPHLPGFTGPVESVYVEYAHPAHALEYYDISKDPDEIDNVADQLTSAQKDELHRILYGLVHCHNAARCRAAAIPERRPEIARPSSAVRAPLVVDGSLDRAPS